MRCFDDAAAETFFPTSITAAEAEFFACGFDENEKAVGAHAVLAPGSTPFAVGNKSKSVDINLFHLQNGHLCAFLLRETARQQGLVLTGTLEPCDFCLRSKGRKADVSKQGAVVVRRSPTS